MLRETAVEDVMPFNTKQVAIALNSFGLMINASTTITVIDNKEHLATSLRTVFPSMRICYLDIDVSDLCTAFPIRPACIVVGSSVPFMSATHVCATLRAMESLRAVPIVMCGQGVTNQDETIALSSGADRYVGGPISAEGLVIHIIAVLREFVNRTASLRQSGNIIEDPKTITFGDLVLPANSYSVVVAGQVVLLTANEFNILCKLAKSAGSIVSTDLLSHTKSSVNESVLVSVRSRIYSLRRKLHASRVQIHTVRNAGYFLRDSTDGY